MYVMRKHIKEIGLCFESDPNFAKGEFKQKVSEILQKDCEKSQISHCQLVNYRKLALLYKSSYLIFIYDEKDNA